MLMILKLMDILKGFTGFFLTFFSAVHNSNLCCKCVSRLLGYIIDGHTQKSALFFIFYKKGIAHTALWDRSFAFPRSVTSCGQQHIQRKSSGQNNHRQISSRLTQPGWTSRFFQDSIRAWIMTGSAGTQSYLDHCGARVTEGRRERWWNGVWRAIVSVGAAED